jgi:hypothetical protein
MRRLIIVAVLVLGTASTAFATSLSTWSGKVGTVGAPPGFYRPSAKLVVGAQKVQAEFNGLTGATHDAPTATTACSASYRFSEEKSSWRYFIAFARSRPTADGGVTNAPCALKGFVLRLRVLSSHKLTAEFNFSTLRPGEEFHANYRAHLSR